MKIKPLIFENLSTNHTSFCVDLTLDNNITFIKGDSGVGKSAMFSFIEEMATEDKRIRCFNYLDINKNYKTSIKNLKDKLIVIDNADLLLDDKMREYIAKDDRNQYILIGRNPKGLRMNYDELYELASNIDGKIVTFSLEKANFQNT